MAVQVPITCKHYGGKNYDAYVSGFEPSLDSIFVYNETQIITETITRMKPPNKWELDIVGGLDYNTARQDFTPLPVARYSTSRTDCRLGCVWVFPKWKRPHRISVVLSR